MAWELFVSFKRHIFAEKVFIGLAKIDILLVQGRCEGQDIVKVG